MQEVPPPTELTRQDVDEIRAAFAAVAVRPAHTGFDAVRIHAVHGYLRLLFPLAARNILDCSNCLSG
ncbi:oxidoreductase [Brucella pseudogrignonensis]